MLFFSPLLYEEHCYSPATCSHKHLYYAYTQYIHVLNSKYYYMHCVKSGTRTHNISLLEYSALYSMNVCFISSWYGNEMKFNEYLNVYTFFVCVCACVCIVLYCVLYMTTMLLGVLQRPSLRHHHRHYGHGVVAGVVAVIVWWHYIPIDRHHTHRLLIIINMLHIFFQPPPSHPTSSFNKNKILFLRIWRRVWK